MKIGRDFLDIQSVQMQELIIFSQFWSIFAIRSFPLVLNGKWHVYSALNDIR